MSNNKQSSVEWLFDNMVQLIEDYDDGKIDYTQYCHGVKKVLEKAKEIHKEESIDFAFSWSHERADRIDIENDYNETFK